MFSTGLFSNHQIHELISIADDSLIEDYLEGRLDSVQVRAFESICMGSSFWRQEVRIVSRLRELSRNEGLTGYLGADKLCLSGSPNHAGSEANTNHKVRKEYAGSEHVEHVEISAGKSPIRSFPESKPKNRHDRKRHGTGKGHVNRTGR